jgi:hypothetical protein
MTRRGRVEDLPQAEGCETPKAGRPKQGAQKVPKTNGKDRHTRRRPGKEKGKGGALGLGHQVNN